MILRIFILFADKKNSLLMFIENINKGDIAWKKPKVTMTHTEGNDILISLDDNKNNDILVPIEEKENENKKLPITEAPLITWSASLSQEVINTGIDNTTEILIPLEFKEEPTIKSQNTTKEEQKKSETNHWATIQINQPAKQTKNKKTPLLQISSLEQKIKEYEEKKTLNYKKKNPKTNNNHDISLSSKTDNKNEQKLRKEHIKNLEKLYKLKKKNSDFKKLIQALVKNYEFSDAWKYLQPLTIEKKLNNINPQLYVYTYFNILDLNNDKQINEFKNTIENIRQANLIPIQELNFYYWLLAIAKEQYSEANTFRKDIADTKYMKFIKQIHIIQEQISKKRDIPKYYQEALISLEMLKSGYFSIAKYLATKAFDQNKKYILPHQILAYNAFLTNHLNESIQYFQNLSKIDPSKHNSYKYMMGISYYWLWDYTNAILHLSQLKNDTWLKTDVLRYLILGYKNIQDTKKALETYQELITTKDLVNWDFVSFFDFVLVEPYNKIGKISITEQEFNLVQTYINKCKNSTKINKNICLLWEIWIRVFSKQWDETTLESLKQLVTTYNQNFSLQLLGDYYRHTNFYKAAKSYYLKASLTAKDTNEKSVIQNKLLLLEE